MEIREKIRRQHLQYNVENSVILRLKNELSLSTKKLTATAREKRMELLNEALSLEKGPSQKKKIYYDYYTFGEGYRIRVGKPGKEAAPDYRGCRIYTGERKGEKTNNPNDMHIQIVNNFQNTSTKEWTFEDMFQGIEDLMHEDLFGLEIFGMIIFRMAFLLDHRRINGKLRYVPPRFALEELEKRIPSIGGVPTVVFLHFLDLLGLNEDVKVYTLGYPDLKQNYGRINTLLTFTHLVAVLLNRRSISLFAGSFARPPSGMAPIPYTKIYDYFPILSPDYVGD